MSTARLLSADFFSGTLAVRRTLHITSAVADREIAAEPGALGTFYAVTVALVFNITSRLEAAVTALDVVAVGDDTFAGVAPVS